MIRLKMTRRSLFRCRLLGGSSSRGTMNMIANERGAAMLVAVFRDFPHESANVGSQMRIPDALRGGLPVVFQATCEDAFFGVPEPSGCRIERICHQDRRPSQAVVVQLSPETGVYVELRLVGAAGLHFTPMHVGHQPRHPYRLDNPEKIIPQKVARGVPHHLP